MRYVVGYMFSPDYREVALIRKAKPEWQRGKLNGVGGKIEIGERKGIAMSREFAEEAGVIIPEMSWLHIRTEFFSNTQESVRKQDSEAKIHHFAYKATYNEWSTCRTMEQEHILKVLVDDVISGFCATLYNIPYLVCMARILLQQPPENRPLP